MLSSYSMVWGDLASIFVVAAIVNYAWELARSPLYARPQEGPTRLWHCGLASLGDGVMVLLILAAGWLVLGRHDCFERSGAGGYLVMLVSGLVLSISVEWASLHVLRLWDYTERMPRLPGLGVGITPVLQMLILPPLIVRIVAAWHGRRALPEADPRGRHRADNTETPPWPEESAVAPPLERSHDD